MSIITFDVETYYDQEYSLKKLTTEEYISDSRFEVIGFSIKSDNTPAVWYTGTHAYLYSILRGFDWRGSILICHHAHFDAAILKWKFGIEPDFYTDTLCIARALNGPDVGGSLGKLVQQYGIGIKGDDVIRAVGKRLRDFSKRELASYGNYCCNDTELTYKLFIKLTEDFPPDELELIDQTIRMYIDPSLMINDSLLVRRLEEVKAEKAKLLQDLMGRLQCANQDEVRVKLASSAKFTEVLKSYGVNVPFKHNKNGKEIPALAKTDLGFIALEEHEDPFVQQLCAARLGVKSTLEESRIERFIGIGKRNRGYLPVPLKYYAAHPGRWGGMDLINLQNLPVRDQKKKTLKNSIIAPPGHVILNADLSQIEARILAWLAGQWNIVKAFAEKRDVYSEDATEIYGFPVSKANPTERFVGKTVRLGLGYGTGAGKLQHTLEVTPPGAKLDFVKCTEIVRIYRRNNPSITDLWRQGDRLLQNLMAWPTDGNSFFFGEHELVAVTPYGIHLPNGLYIRYSNLRVNRGEVIHDSRKGPISIWGGVVTENVVQALARIVIAENMIKIRKKFKIALTVHDSLVMVVPISQVDECREFVENVMTTPPTWAEGLPVAVEIKQGVSYGDC